MITEFACGHECLFESMYEKLRKIYSFRLSLRHHPREARDPLASGCFWSNSSTASQEKLISHIADCFSHTLMSVCRFMKQTKMSCKSLLLPSFILGCSLSQSLAINMSQPAWTLNWFIPSQKVTMWSKSIVFCVHNMFSGLQKSQHTLSKRIW